MVGILPLFLLLSLNKWTAFGGPWRRKSCPYYSSKSHCFFYSRGIMRGTEAAEFCRKKGGVFQDLGSDIFPDLPNTRDYQGEWYVAADESGVECRLFVKKPGTSVTMTRAEIRRCDDGSRRRVVCKKIDKRKTIQKKLLNEDQDDYDYGDMMIGTEIDNEEQMKMPGDQEKLTSAVDVKDIGNKTGLVEINGEKNDKADFPEEGFDEGLPEVDKGKTEPSTDCGEGLRLNQDVCVDVNECAESPAESLCSGGECSNTHGSYVCVCPKGFRPGEEKTTCVDIDECETSSDCEQMCINTRGSFKCSCNAGFVLDIDRRSCKDLNECSTDDDLCQDICKNTPGSYECECKKGYWLMEDGKNCEDADECSDGSHVCQDICINEVGSYRCDCSPGFALSDDGTLCVDVDECEGDHGCQHECSNLPGSFKCICRAGFDLSDGKACIDRNECDQDPCSQLCVNTEGSYKCGCKEGYEVDPLDPSNCKDVDECSLKNGGCPQTCINLSGSFKCSCKKNFKMDPTGILCLDVDECAEGLHDCEQHCQNLDEGKGYKCYCREGYTYDGASCLDVDECSLSSDDCSHTCSNTKGGYTCSCPDGFVLGGDGRNCEDIDECVGADMGGCDQACFNTDGSFYCSCSNGYELSDNNFNCIDLDECSQGMNGCDHSCQNEDGGYSCSCDKGFQLDVDGMTCNDLDECNLDQDLCAFGCRNLVPQRRGDPTYECFCDRGFRLAEDGRSCVDVDECGDRNHDCQQICVNLEGAYECGCREGFSLAVDEKSCSDLDECLVKNGGCQQVCLNNEGDYKCDCHKGYELTKDGSTCFDIDECSFESATPICRDGAVCFNTPGGYECICPEGYVNSDDGRGCRDKDECSDDLPCGSGGRCVNTVGSFECECDQGFVQMGGDKTCIDVDECALSTDWLADDGAGSIGPKLVDFLNKGGCGGKKVCVNFPGDFDCICAEGFVASEASEDCEDVDECAQPDACDARANCVNTLGSFKCACLDGYEQDDDGICRDIDECATENPPCPAGTNSLCVNNDGGFECQCKEGYEMLSRNANLAFPFGKACTPIKECKRTRLGDTYGGTKNTTKSGLTCLSWAETVTSLGVVKTEDELIKKYPVLKKARNNCRNPDYDPMGPWCYIEGVPNTKYQYCDIPICPKECLNVRNPRSYIGTLSISRTGKTCLRWSDMLRNFPNVFRGHKALRRVALAQSENYCRFISSINAVACYVTAPSEPALKLPTLEQCQVEACPKEDPNVILVGKRVVNSDEVSLLKRGATLLEE